MRFVKLLLVWLPLVCATAFAQSGRPPLPQPTPTPTPDPKPAAPTVVRKLAFTDNDKYRVVFANKATMSIFVDQLNRSGAERYRLKTPRMDTRIFLM
jgi:hypothetical protein